MKRLWKRPERKRYGIQDMECARDVRGAGVAPEASRGIERIAHQLRGTIALRLDGGLRRNARRLAALDESVGCKGEPGVRLSACWVL